MSASSIALACRKKIIFFLPLALALSGAALAQSQSAEPAPEVPPAAEPAASEPAPSTGPTVTSLPVPAPAQEESKRKAQVYTWLSGGTTFAYGQTYANLGLGVGWLTPSGIAPNAELGFSFGASPSIWTFRPGVTWFLPIPVISPYIGAFYTRWFIGDTRPDQNGIGGRAGFSPRKIIFYLRRPPPPPRPPPKPPPPRLRAAASRFKPPPPCEPPPCQPCEVWRSQPPPEFCR